MILPALASAEESPRRSAGKTASGPKLTIFFSVNKDGTITAMEEYKISHQTLDWGPSPGRLYASHSPFVMEPTAEIFITSIDGKESHEHKGKTAAVLTAQGPGPHTYRVYYTVRGNILFREDHDSLAWGVQYSPEPVSVVAIVQLPEGASFREMSSRLGHETVGHKPVLQKVSERGRALFIGTQPMERGEHFLFRVRWDRGFVTPDASLDMQRTLSLALWCAAAAVALLCFAFWYKFGRDPVRGLVIPLFHPPKLADGFLLSPGAVNYIMHAASLTTAGFTSVIMSLAVQKALRLSGSGSRKDPYLLERTDKKPAGLLTDEQAAVEHLFPGGKNALQLDHHAARTYTAARAAAYTALASRFRSLWSLRFATVAQMHAAAYGLTMLVLGIFWISFTGDVAMAFVVLSIASGTSVLWHFTVRRLHQTWMTWREMGIATIAALSAFCLLTPAILFYDLVLVAFGFEDYPGYAFMRSWLGPRLSAYILLFAFLRWRTGSLAAALRAALKVLQYLTGYFFAGGLTWAFCQALAPSTLAALMTSLLLPTLFVPIMKQPTQECTELTDKIRGFAMYIGTAEASRLNTLNPPERTPEEFTRVLPYAVALGLEKAWAAKFAEFSGTLNFRGGREFMLRQYQDRIYGN